MSKIKLAALSVLTALSATQVGCTDREVTAGIVGAAVGAIMTDSARANPQPPPPRRRCERVQERVCDTYRTYGGGEVYQCVDRIYDTCERYRYRKISINNTQNAEAADLNISDISAAYKLQPEGAQKLISALAEAQAAKDDASARSALAKIGLDIDELKALGTSGDPSDAMIDRMARALDQNPQHTKLMVNSIIEMARAQQAARAQNLNM